MNDSTKKLTGVLKKSDSGIENQREIVPVEVDTEDETEGIASNIRALPNSSIFSDLMTLGEP